MELSTLKDTEMKERVGGLKAVMPKFDFLFSCSLGERILKQTDILSKTLQNSTISAAQEQALASDFRIYSHLQEVLVKDVRGDSWDYDLDEIIKFYDKDFNRSSL